MLVEDIQYSHIDQIYLGMMITVMSIEYECTPSSNNTLNLQKIVSILIYAILRLLVISISGFLLNFSGAKSNCVKGL